MTNYIYYYVFFWLRFIYWVAFAPFRVIVEIVKRRTGGGITIIKVWRFAPLIGLEMEARDVDSLYPHRESVIPETFLARLGLGGDYLGLAQSRNCDRVVQNL
ncbi:hypothetical protein BMS3Bbin10_02506 [bacterium BMS3Bbin10]|nr:hypothetical protein BMS3Bbin10_02506 [bacterium BMS3Bbin10]